MLDLAEQILISRCMKAHGFTFVPVCTPPSERPSFRYVIDDVVWAREHGFGDGGTRGRAQAMRPNPNQQYFDALAPGEQLAALAALNGERPDGLSVAMPMGGVITASDRSCRADAQRRLYGDLEAWFQATTIVGNLAPLYVAEVEQDARFTKAVEDWARCMSGAGHPYPSPRDLRSALDDLTKGLGPAEAHDVEVRLAVAEATCARDTALAATVEELDRVYGDRVREKYRSQIEAERRMQHAALPRAREITAGGS
ncbi:hypothetical protein [Polyangium mundeleinium]|uniref:Uncharacterized protein n=1 Tax=Polyangium mundeleinium TaxID=2995306 RepID=A0ABT5EWE8_9BACT|nr:hypothetical protein [Polyangium mundeleinium]MDC0746138.1 hypothetical protein [Polyangium mundeleinium]